jgi:hypothetical protein
MPARGQWGHGAAHLRSLLSRRLPARGQMPSRMIWGIRLMLLLGAISPPGMVVSRRRLGESAERLDRGDEDRGGERLNRARLAGFDIPGVSGLGRASAHPHCACVALCGDHAA